LEKIIRNLFSSKETPAMRIPLEKGSARERAVGCSPREELKKAALMETFPQVEYIFV
jgi:hypothetical protein